MDLEAEPGADEAAGAGEAEAADLRGGHRLPAPAGLEPTRWMGLAHESAWLRRKQNVVPDRADGGVGKSFLACALAQQACRDGFSALYKRAPQLFRDLPAARAAGGLSRLLVSAAAVRPACGQRKRRTRMPAGNLWA